MGWGPSWWDGSRVGGMGGGANLRDRTPPGRLGIFKKRLCRMDAGTGQIVYVYFQSPTYSGDFPGADFLI